MGFLSLKFDSGAWMREFEAAKEAWIADEVVPALAYAGEEFVNHARSLPSLPASARKGPHQPNYIDDSRNLRGANSYEVYRKGKAVAGKVGRTETRELFEGAKDSGADVELLTGNGMDYASAVEALEYDVVSSAQAKLELELRGRF
jgi:hypothetical protein